MNELDLISCPTEEISAYIDGDLTAAREMELDLHFASCTTCAEELNLQKQFVCGLNSTLRHEGELALPPNFARHIVANAESTVAGLRRPRERYNAIFICVGLCVFILFALGAEAGRMVEGAAATADQARAVGSFFSHLIYSFFVGVTIILRSLAAQLSVDSVSAIGISAVIAAFTWFVSRRVLRTRRA